MGREVSVRFDPSRIKTLAIIGFGEVGQCFAAAFAGSAAAKFPLALRVGDVEPPGSRRARLEAEAERLGAPLEGGPGPWLAGADLILSSVTSDRAVEVARAAVEFLRPGAAYLDLNTAPKATMTEVARILEGRAATVDGAILGLIAMSGVRVPLLLSGPDSQAMAAFLNERGCQARSLGGAVGDASGVKLLRSVVMKGLEALLIESFVAAEKQGLRNQVIDALADLGQTPAKITISTLLTTHLRHARRRAVEVDDAREMLAGVGSPPRMMTAAAATFARSLQAGIVSDEAAPNLDDALERLVSAHGR